jgi:hypothetical protein
LLFAEGFGGSTRDIHFAPVEQFRDTEVPPRVAELVPVAEWRGLWNRRLRPYLLNDSQRVTYQEVANDSLLEDAVSTLRSWRHSGLCQPSSARISASLSIK